jgi:transposase-like protein
MTFFEFEKKFPNEKAAIDHFLDIRYQGNLTCPHCGATISIYRYRDRPKFFQCYRCNNTFSPFKDTIFEKTHIDMRRWFYAIKMFLNSRKGISGCQLERELGVTYKTAWRMLQQIRIAMANEKEREKFEVYVEMDETMIGGKPRKPNAILDKDGNVIARTTPHNKRGRGANKMKVAGIKEMSTTKVYIKFMPPNEKGEELSGKQLREVIREACKEGTIVATDDYGGYKILDKKRQQKVYGHVTVNHSKGQYCTPEGINTNGIENFWSILKRGIIGIYHHISEEYIQRYLDEFAFRQNTRLDTNMFDVLLGQCVLTGSKEKIRICITTADL